MCVQDVIKGLSPQSSPGSTPKVWSPRLAIYTPKHASLPVTTQDGENTNHILDHYMESKRRVVDPPPTPHTPARIEKYGVQLNPI